MNDMERYTGLSPSHAPRARVLVADDDPSTRRFLGDALRALGYRVELAEDGAQAIDTAINQPFDALLLDCRMPHAGAVEVLSALRQRGDAASAHAVAVATSAEVTQAQRADLRRQGFTAVVEKPCQVATLDVTLCASLGVPASTPTLDDEAGMTATGDADTMRALRELLREELAQLQRELARHTPELSALNDRLHRLRSACGFCGATRLAQQARALQLHISQCRDVDATSLQRFRDVLDTTLAALRAG
jgi:two-component system, OmpR family, response regulator